MWNLDGCHSRINEHEVEAMPQNLVSHLVATDGSLFLIIRLKSRASKMKSRFALL